MYNSIVMTFDDHKEAAQIQSALRCLQETNLLVFDATVISKDKWGKLRVLPMYGEERQLAPSLNALTGISPDKEFMRNVLDSLPQENTALFMLMGEDDSNTALLTMLMLFAPSSEPIVLPQGAGPIDSADDHLKVQVERYQAAVANLEILGADSTEDDVEDIFRAVDDAYDRLVYCISAAQDVLAA